MKSTKTEATKSISEQTYAKARIAALDARLGVGIGAKRERARLAKLLQK